MKYGEKRGLKLSMFQLGTVQLGMNYGITGSTAKPKREDAFSILDKAMEVGVNALDTANNYGDSEAVIGEWLRGVEKDKRPFIITKVGPFDHTDDKTLYDDIVSQTEKCIETLGVDSIDMLMAHDFADYEKNPETVKKAFFDLREKGLIKYTAISAYSDDDYGVIAASGFDAVQIPINIFDHSQIENGGIKALSDAGMHIFARSVFLQGLVFMTPEAVDPRMSFVIPYLEKFRALCYKFGMEPSTLAASFVATLPGVTGFALGCQTPLQVADNAALIDKIRKLTDAEMAEIRDAFLNIDKRVINPRLWFNHF